MNETRQCCRCDTILPLTAFARQPGNPRDLAYRCKACEAQRMREFRATHPQYRQREVKRVQESAQQNVSTVREG